MNTVIKKSIIISVCLCMLGIQTLTVRAEDLSETEEAVLEQMPDEYQNQEYIPENETEDAESIIDEEPENSISGQASEITTAEAVDEELILEVTEWSENTDFYAPVRTGWIKESGSWHYYNGSGNSVTGWQEISGIWYFFNTSGVMQTGWQKINEKWYYFGGSGAMRTDWQQISGVWYYFGTSGSMKTGWQKIDEKWYYFGGSGAMRTDWQQISDVWYYFGTSGSMKTGWQNISDKWYYFRNSGAMTTGWLSYNNYWYYMNDSGAMQTGWKEISGKWYYFDGSGKMLTNQYVGNYYVSSSGAMDESKTKNSGSAGTLTKEYNGQTYTANTNTKKFHKHNCRYAAEISYSNIGYSSDRNYLTSLGYSPCKVCKP